MQVTTDGLSRLFGSDLGPARLVRNLGMNLLDRLPLIKNKLISHAMGR
jgi:2-polyprenyl-6-methoxyphenol hydroxylase-like FAD-dependent oxidoreductase